MEEITRKLNKLRMAIEGETLIERHKRLMEHSELEYELNILNHFTGILKELQSVHKSVEDEYLQKRAELKRDYLNSCIVMRDEGWGKYLLSRMKKIEVLADEITKTDEAALEYLLDISCMSKSTNELKVEFCFDANPYFVDSILSKTFRTNGEENPKLEQAVGMKIKWQAGKKLTNSQSFFKFFELQPTNNTERARIQMEHDYQIGLKIQDEMNFSSFSYQTAIPGIQLKLIDPVSHRVQNYMVLRRHFSRKKVELEAEYQDKFRPMYNRRFEIVSGKLLSVGVPDFWLKAMKNNDVLSEQITERDEGALKYLMNIEWKRLETHGMGFYLKFIFAPNPYFENSYLVKEFIRDQTFGSEIQWRQDHNLTHKLMGKSKRKGKPIFRPIFKPCESFFNFFRTHLSSPPPDEPTDEAKFYGPAIVEGLKAQIRYDYYVGKIIRDKIIPHASVWFTGEALQEGGEYCDLEDRYYDSDSEDGNEEEDNDEYEDVDYDSVLKDGNEEEEEKEDVDEYEDMD